MSDATPPAADRIDLQDEDAAAGWCRHFGITQSQLEEAVQAAGTDPPRCESTC